MAAKWRRDDRRVGETGKGDGREGWLYARQDAASDKGRFVHSFRPSALLCREHVPTDGTGRCEVLRQADELPDAPQDLRFKGTFLSRSAHPACRIWYVLSL